MRQEMAKQKKMRETIQKKFHQMEDQKSDVEVQRETLRAQIAALEKGTVWIGTFFIVSPLQFLFCTINWTSINFIRTLKSSFCPVIFYSDFSKT